jgi:hypothetical protein
MRGLATFIFILLIAGAIYYFNFMPKPSGPTYSANDLWAGDQESGCMYPVTKVSDGRDPIWWSERNRQWNIFNSKAEATAAGYHECP